MQSMSDNENLTRLLLKYHEAAETIGTTDNKGRTALHHAAKRGFERATELLIKKDPGQVYTWEKDMKGRTALYVAAESGHYKVVRILARDTDQGTQMVRRKDNRGLLPGPLRSCQ